MCLTTDITNHDMWNIAKNLSYNELPMVESVCKSWQKLLRSDYVIKKLIQRIFPEYNVLPNIPLSLQYRQLQFMPLNIARGVFLMSGIDIEDEYGYESKAFRVSVKFSDQFSVENKKNENFPRYMIDSTTDIQFSSDESKMITTEDNVMQVMDPFNGNCLKTLVGHSRTVQGVRIHSNGKSAVSICEQRVITWDLETGEKLKTYSIIINFNKFEIMPDRDLVFFIPTTGQGLELLRKDSGFYHVHLKENISAMVSTPDQKMLLVSTGWKIDVMKVDTMEVLHSIPFSVGICRLHETGYTRSAIGEMRFTTYGTELFLRERTSKSYAVVLHFFDLNKENQKLLTYDEFQRTHSPDALEIRLKELMSTRSA